jgi:hypothetical protein
MQRLLFDCPDCGVRVCVCYSPVCAPPHIYYRRDDLHGRVNFHMQNSSNRTALGLVASLRILFFYHLIPLARLGAAFARLL